MSDVINVHDFKTNYSKYLEEAVGGKEILLGKRGKAIAKLVPLQQTKDPRLPGALKGKVWISDDFDEPMMALWGSVGSRSDL
jgi:prevent-host-death family protein